MKLKLDMGVCLFYSVRVYNPAPYGSVTFLMNGTCKSNFNKIARSNVIETHFSTTFYND